MFKRFPFLSILGVILIVIAHVLGFLILFANFKNLPGVIVVPLFFVGISLVYLGGFIRFRSAFQPTWAWIGILLFSLVLLFQALKSIAYSAFAANLIDHGLHATFVGVLDRAGCVIAFVTLVCFLVTSHERRHVSRRIGFK